MLRKKSLHALLISDGGDKFLTHYERILKIKQVFRGLKEPDKDPDSLLMPYCHLVAHAYALAFDVAAVNGEKVFITETRTWWFGHFVIAKASRYAHSWNLLRLSSGEEVILDLIPDETCSMSPILVLSQNPSYTEPRDGVAKRCIAEYLASEYQQCRIKYLADEFKRIDGK